MKRTKLFLVLLVECIFASAGIADSFKIVALPDTQGYSEYYPATFSAQTQWIVNHAGDATPIAFVTHLGDVVSDSYQSFQWTNADTAIDKLDGVVPYSICIGNHDYSDHRDPNLIPYKQVGAAEFLAKFGPSRFSSYTWYKGYHGTGLNCYQIFTAGGRQWLHLNLEYEPDDEVLLWAQRIMDANPTLPVIISTHAYLSSSGSLGGVGDEYGPEAGNGGRNMWYRFVSHNDQIFLVINGHYPGAALLTSQNDYGHDVFQMCVDYQALDNEGNGYLRTLEFNLSTNQILAKSYSPTLGTYLTDPNNEFTLNINFATRLNSFSSREVISTVQGGNVIVTEVNSIDPNVTLSIPTGQATSQFSLIPPGTADYTENQKGVYYVKAGSIGEDDSLSGIYIASVTQNTRHDIDVNQMAFYTTSVETSTRGPCFVTPCRTSMWLDVNDSNTFVDNGGRSNINFSAAFFPFSGGWTCGRVRFLDDGLPMWCFIGSQNVQLGVNLVQYPNSNENPSFSPYRPKATTFNSTDGDRGVWTLSIPGVDSLKDGVLLVCAGRDEDNYASATPNPNGSGWVICVKGNNSDSGNTETDPFNFVYVPYETPGIIVGRITTDGGIANGTGGFSVERTRLGVHKLTIDGYTPADGVLIISDELEDDAVDNFTTYQPEGDHWIIENRDLPQANLIGGSQVVYSFVFIPFNNPPAGPGPSRVFNPTKFLAGNFSTKYLPQPNDLACVFKDQGSLEISTYKHNVGNVYLAINGDGKLTDDNLGLLFATPRKLWCNDEFGAYYPLFSTDPRDYRICGYTGGILDELKNNNDFSVLWLTSQSLDTFGWNSASSGMHPLHGAAPTVTTNYLETEGRYKLELSGIDPDDGILMVQARTTTAKIASVRPLSDGWEITTRDHGQFADEYYAASFDYAFFPYQVTAGAGEYEMALVSAAGTVINATSPIFTITKTGTGTYTISIAGATPEDGALILQTYDGDDTYGASFTSMAYEPNGASFDVKIYDVEQEGGVPIDKNFVVLYAPFVVAPYNPDVPANGSGTQQNPYQIWNQSDLEKVKNVPNAYFIQRANINLAGTTYTDAVVSTSGTTYFTGDYNGNHFTIQNLKINTNSTSCGLFSHIGNGKVYDLSLTDVNIVSTTDYIGSLVGVNEGIITNCSVAGKVTGNTSTGGLAGQSKGGTMTNCSAAVTVTGNERVGGLIGFTGSGSSTPETKVLDCHATGDVTGNGYVGGLIGRDVYYCTVINCYATGDVSNIGTSRGLCGGLVGLWGGAAVGGTIEDCYATGTVTSSSMGQTGGLVGQSEKFVTRCYATGTVSGAADVGGLIGYCKYATGITSNSYASGNVTGSSNVGGFIGNAEANSVNCYAAGSVTNTGDYTGGFIGKTSKVTAACYSVGAVTGTTNVGGFAGYSTGSVDANCFWDTQTSGQATSAGGTGKITTQMKTQSTFTNAGWNFVSTWKIRESATYPKLMWQAFGGDIDWDGDVDFTDLRLLADNWLATGSGLDGDIYVDNTVNFLDFAQFASDWATQQ